MKQGISLFSFSENTDVRWMFEHAKKAGYDGVEPVLSESGYLNPQTPEKDVLAMKRMADDMGLEIPSVGVWSLWQNNLVSDSEKTRQKAFGIVQKQIEAAHLLGAKTILVVPGYVGCNFVEHPEKIRYDIAYERAQDALSRLAPEAQLALKMSGIASSFPHWKLGGSWMRSAPTMSVCIWMSVMPCISATRNNGSRSSATASKSYICLTIALIRQALALS